MYLLPTTNYQQRNLQINKLRTLHQVAISHKENVKKQLKSLGVSKLALLRKECRTLPSVIHPNESLGGVVYGKTDTGFALLVATEGRVIFIDDMLLYEFKNEITYDVVSGVSISHAGPGATVVLHTRIKDYPIQTLNLKCAKAFVKYIESRVLEHTNLMEG